MPVTPLGYPLDLTGVAPSNLISNEIRTFTIAADRVFVPAAGPFFTTGMQIRHGVTNVLLQPNTQYKLLHLHKTASLMARKEICAVILILDNTVPSVKLTYQIIGSYFADTADTIRDLVEANPITTPTTVPWGSIFGAPSQFPPVEHLHHVDELYGMSDVVAVLEQLRQAILLGDSFAISALYQYINNLLTNLDYATYNQVLTLFNSIERSPVKVYKTYADLRAETDVINDAALVYIVLGKLAPNDGKGRAFYWDIDSAIVDDDDFTVKPTIITGLNTGRFVSILAVEKNLAVLEEKVSNAGIAVELAETNYTAADYNTLTLTRKWYTGSVNPNRPFDNAVLDVISLTPTNCIHIAYNNGNRATRYGYGGTNNAGHTWLDWVFSEQAELSITSHYGDVGGSLNNNDKVGRHWFDGNNTETPFPNGWMDVVNIGGVGSASHQIAYDGDGSGIATRRRLNNVWSNWAYPLDTVTAKRYGIESVLSVDNAYTGDMDALITSGKHWIGTGVANAPFDEAEVDVSVIEGTVANPTRVLQKAINGTQIAAREGVLVATVWTFTPWVNWGTSDAGVPECHLGITISHFGIQTLVMPCWIGEAEEVGFAPYDVTVFISGELKTVSLYSIEPLMTTMSGGGLINDHRKNVYLEESPVGTFRLILGEHFYSPSFIPQNAMEHPRKNMYAPGTVPSTSNRLFLGMVVQGDGGFIATRSWFQDPGFIRHYQSFAHSSHLPIPPITAIQGGTTGKHKRLQITEAIEATQSSSSFKFTANGLPIDWKIPILVWRGETVTFKAQLLLSVTSSNATRPIIVVYFVDNRSNTTAVDLYLRNPNGSSEDPTTDFSQYTSEHVLTNTDEDKDYQLQLTALMSNSGFKVAATQSILSNVSHIDMILDRVKHFRKPLVNFVDPAYWFPNLRVIYLTGTVLDLDLKAYHDNIYGGPAPANTTVEFIVSSGCLVCSSSTSTYALINPNTWASGVVTKLTVQSGGAVAGRGGNGGRGGRAYITYPPVNTYTYHFGGALSLPSSVVHGKNGGNAIRTFRPLIITLAGIISVGGGGGGASGGAIARYVSSMGNTPGVTQSGSGAGGGWPLGAGGLPGQIDNDDLLTADYVDYSNQTYYKNHIHHIGNAGQTVSSATPAIAQGGAARSNYTDYHFYANTPNGGAGGCPPLAVTATPGAGGTYYGEIDESHGGDGGNSGAAGTIAINGIANVTLINNGGSIYGSQI